jgi:hypothetical protein
MTEFKYQDYLTLVHTDAVELIPPANGAAPATLAAPLLPPTLSPLLDGGILIL